MEAVRRNQRGNSSPFSLPSSAAIQIRDTQTLLPLDVIRSVKKGKHSEVLTHTCNVMNPEETHSPYKIIQIDFSSSGMKC